MLGSQCSPEFWEGRFTIKIYGANSAQPELLCLGFLLSSTPAVCIPDIEAGFTLKTWRTMPKWWRVSGIY